MDRIWNYSGQKSHMSLQEMKSCTHKLEGLDFIWTEQQQEYVFCQVELVDIFKLEIQNQEV